MNLHIYPKSLDISLIDFENFSYAIYPDKVITPEKSLAESIARHGILHPPIVKKTISSSYAIVTGRKRLRAFRSLFPEEKSCGCMVVPEDVPEVELFSFLLEEITTRRPLTPIEKAIFLQKISSLIDEKQIAEKFLARMGLPPDPAQIKQSKMLLDLEKPLIHALHRGDLHETVARDILRLSSNDREAVYGVISALHPGMNYQKKLLNICSELAAREDKSIALLLDDKEVREILNHRDANPPQKTKNLMNLLMSKYKPRSSRAEDAFNRFVASLQLPKNVSVAHTQSFEDDSITLTITFANKKSLQNIINKIKDAIQNSDN